MTTAPESGRPSTGRPQPEHVLFPGIVDPLPPPDIRPGWLTGPPDVVGVGAMRAGTTWWWLLLSEHERFAKSAIRHKEYHFFDHYMRAADIDPETYHRYFPRPPGMIAGEWTPRYMFDFWTPHMLRRAAPRAKLLVLLRDPVERFRSALAFTRGRGYPSTHVMLHQQYSRSLYGQQVRNLMSIFPAGQILVLQYEQCAADPVAHMHRTLEFLGLDPAGWKPRIPLTARINESKLPKPELDRGTRESLEVAFQADCLPLFGLFPALDPALWPTMTGAGGKAPAPSPPAQLGHPPGPAGRAHQ